MYITEVPQFLKFILCDVFVKDNEVNLLQLRTSYGQNNFTRNRARHENRIYFYLCFLKCRTRRKVLHTLRFPKFFCYVQGLTEITPTFGGVTARAMEGIQWWEWSRWLAAVLPVLDDAMGWSDEHRGFVVETFFKNNESVIATQRAFRRHSGHLIWPRVIFSLGLPTS